MDEFAVTYLLKILNKLWETHQTIPDWSTSIIIPIPKPGQDPAKLTSYRPIALTSTLCKIYERIVTTRLQYYLETNKILSPNQSAFRKHRSTLDQLIKLHNAAHLAINNNQFTRAIFLDYSKAFDLVWNEGLLFKLRKLKLHGNIYYFIKSFLSNRTIRVQIKGALSDPFPITNGLPQGSVISPLLFLIYINDLPISSAPNSHTSIFADDCAIWQTSTNLTYLTKQLQFTLNKIVKWSHKWGFQINIEKSNNIIFAKSRRR
jgi:hypothetical protein